MTTVTRRTFRSSPHRDALATWAAISDLLSRTNTGAQQELGSVAGIASSIIADKACENSPILVSCEGPQTRIYCLYDDDAIDGSDANEDVLGFDPLKVIGQFRCHVNPMISVGSNLRCNGRATASQHTTKPKPRSKIPRTIRKVLRSKLISRGC